LLRERAANAVYAVIQCAMEANNDPARTPHGALQLVFSACETLNAESDANAVERWRRVVAREAENAPAIATLAFVEAEWATGVGWSAEAAALRAAARQHLQKARSMDRSLGLTYVAEALLVPPSHYGDRIAILDRGLAVDPNCASLHLSMIKARQQVGWSEDAIASARRGVSLAPNSPRIRSNLISVLAYAGYLDDARSELQAAARLWPASSALQDARYRLDLRFGDAAALIRMIDRGSALAHTSKTFANGPERALLLARTDPTPANVETAAKVALRYDATPFALQNLIVLGRIDQAYSFIRDPGRFAMLRDGATDILFRIYMRPFVLDRRFMPLASRLGLVRFWQSRGWPDFCHDKDLPYNCKAEARRLLLKPV
jgi:tetratricopeptide (TPR) repeat protein